MKLEVGGGDRPRVAADGGLPERFHGRAQFNNVVVGARLGGCSRRPRFNNAPGFFQVGDDGAQMGAVPIENVGV